MKFGCCNFFCILLKAFVQRQEKIAFASFTCSFKAEDTTKRNIYPKYMLGSIETVKLEGSYVSGIPLHFTSLPPFLVWERGVPPAAQDFPFSDGEEQAVGGRKL